jgi:hypothetical protein
MNAHILLFLTLLFEVLRKGYDPNLASNRALNKDEREAESLTTRWMSTVDLYGPVALHIRT